MVATAAQIAAARAYAPPLFEVGQLDRRGARLKRVSPKAVGYVRRSGLSLYAVYPDAPYALQQVAPPATFAGEQERFCRATGLSRDEVFGNEAVEPPKVRWSWGWAAVGGLVGAALTGGLIGVAAGALLGGVR